MRDLLLNRGSRRQLLRTLTGLPGGQLPLRFRQLLGGEFRRDPSELLRRLRIARLYQT